LISAPIWERVTELVTVEGIGDRIEFQVSDTHSLELEDGLFEVVVVHPLMSHLHETAAVIRDGSAGEARRLGEHL
jgi:hypothetical protein